MDSQLNDDPKAIKNLLEKLLEAQAVEASKTIFDVARGYYESGKLTLSIPTLERVLELNDPLYVANALLLLADIYKKLRKPADEQEIYKKIAKLPEPSKRFVDPAWFGVALSRAGDLDGAKEHLLHFLRSYPEDLGAEADLVELLFVRGEFEECLRRAEKLVNRPEPRFQVIGRLFKGAAHLSRGEQDTAKSEFRWIAKYVLSLGGIPGDFNWDFTDSSQALAKLNLPEAQLVLQLLDKRLGFAEFQTRWNELESASI